MPTRISETTEPPFQLGVASGADVSTPAPVPEKAVAGVTPAQVASFRSAMGALLRAEVVRAWKQRGVTVESWGRAFEAVELEPGGSTWERLLRLRDGVWREAFEHVDPRQAIRTAGLSNHPAVR